MVGFRSVILAFFLAGSSAAFAIQQPKAMGVGSSLLDSKVLKMSGGESTPELSVSPCKQVFWQHPLDLDDPFSISCLLT